MTYKVVVTMKRSVKHRSPSTRSFKKINELQSLGILHRNMLGFFKQH